ncbi:hypothetical protein QCA50_002260 [Cerrena zonata]|uniref:PEHE domain-containing protein n=1 Tax=Cerrena zonata TaxID=2478898 RepID=A0AAW0GPE7_9APHY
MHASTSSEALRTPSAKAVGKRPAIQEIHTVATIDMSAGAPVSSASTPGAPGKSNGAPQSRPKRVLPSRSRRGGSGVGVGNCDVDLMILETRRRRLENEPLIPIRTKFLLTTNSSLVPPSEDNVSFESQLNTHAYSRYFDRPEVQRAYQQQQTIQTPEFTQLPEDATVGGRFRPRGEEEAADTSDAAYEKRHRKYETFEKRQRLREKEKLKHEQYKLKERIDQLRAMDTSAFLALPASAFSDTTTGPATFDVHDTDPGLSELPGAHVNGAAAYNEGERRRKEMLDVALTLEERYRVLLPPDRKWLDKKEKDKKAKRDSTAPTVSVEPEPSVGHSSEVEQEEEEEEEEEEELPPKPLPTSHGYSRDSDGESEVDFEERDRQRSKQLKLRIKFPPRKPDGISPAPSKGKPSLHGKVFPSAPFSPASSPQSRPISTKLVVRSKDGKFLPKNKRYVPDGKGSLSAPIPPRKRHRADSSASQHTHSPSTPTTKPHHISYAGAAGRPERTQCALLVSALRNATAPTARKTQRHVTAFGIRVPQEIEEVRDFEIPEWLLSSLEDDQSSVGLNGYEPITDDYVMEYEDEDEEVIKDEATSVTALE